MKAFGTTRRRVNYRDSRRKSVNDNIEKTADGSSQSKD
jgi:hypothetical protein